MGSIDPRCTPTVSTLELTAPPIRSRRGLALITLGWVAVGLFAGAAAVVADRLTGRPSDVTAQIVAPVVAGLCWVPLTLLADAAARRFPWSRRPTSAVVAANLVLIGAASFLLNGGWSLSMALLGGLPWGEVGAVTVTGALRWLHVNALVFTLLLAGANYLRRRTAAAAAASSPDERVSDAATIRVATATGERLVPVGEIAWIGGAGDYSAIHVGDEELLHGERLKNLERRLDGERFVRIHRSTIVNVRRIAATRPLGRGDREVRLDCGTTLRVSRRRRAELDRLLDDADPTRAAAD